MTGTPDASHDYCREKAAPAGSSLYYSLLYQRPADKPMLFILHAFHNALADVISECSDPGVAHMKFAWWQEELQRLADNQPRHPITRAMATLPAEALPRRLFAHLVEHYDAHINLQQPADYRQLISFLQDGPGSYWQHLAGLTGYQHPDTPALVSALGTRFAYFRVLQEQPLHVPQQRFYCPRDETADTDSVAIYTRQSQRLEQELAALTAQIAPVDRKSQRHVIILAHILRQTARETHLAGCNLLHQHVSLTPLRKLWIAWRSRLFNT